jgi:hypothetical protein
VARSRPGDGIDEGQLPELAAGGHHPVPELAEPGLPVPEPGGRLEPQGSAARSIRSWSRSRGRSLRPSRKASGLAPPLPGRRTGCSRRTGRRARSQLRPGTEGGAGRGQEVELVGEVDRGGPDSPGDPPGPRAPGGSGGGTGWRGRVPGSGTPSGRGVRVATSRGAASRVTRIQAYRRWRRCTTLKRGRNARMSRNSRRRASNSLGTYSHSTPDATRRSSRAFPSRPGSRRGAGSGPGWTSPRRGAPGGVRVNR